MTELTDTQPGCGVMVERVARAICKSKTGIANNVVDHRIVLVDGLPTVDSQPLWLRFQKEARAAIEAMRLPTEAMMDAGLDTEDWGEHGETWIKPDECWRAMIDAALAPQPEPVNLSERPNTDPSPTQA